MNSDPSPSGSALVLRPPDKPSVGDDVRLQRLWLAARRREWTSLAVIAASKSVDTLHVADLLANLAWTYRGQPSCVLDLRDLSLRLVEYHQREVKALAAAGNIVVVALRSISENPTAVAIARGADAVVLCVDLGAAEIKAAERTITEVGRERVLGAIVVRPSPRHAPAGR